MKFLLIIFFLAVYCNHGMSTAYYFSNNGNDNNNGRSTTTAWGSLKKLMSVTHLLKAGDSLLFERGSLFYGQINISTSGIYIGAFGSGAKPRISGSIEVCEWKAHDENIWSAEILHTEAPGNLFIDNMVQVLGRYPNTGYLSLSDVSASDTSVTDNSLSFKDGYWARAELVVKSSRWTIENLPVKKYSNNTFTTSVSAAYTLEPGFGYFIQKHLATLDQPGEWFFQDSTNLIYLFLQPGVNPTSQNIRVSILDFGLRVDNAHNVLIENIAFEQQRLVGVSINNSQHVNLQYIDILDSGKNGIEVINSKYPCVENSLIANTHNNGVEWHNNSGGTFSHNTIWRTGMHPGRGASGDGAYIALRITADQSREGANLIQNNIIDSTGYIGIDFRTGHTTIKGNSISNFCLVKDDGGGIYTWENKYGFNTLEDNFIYNGMGSGEGTINPTELFASGIYIDDRSSHIHIINNRILNCATSGIFLHNAKVIAIEQNYLANNGHHIANKEKGQLYIKLDTHGHFSGDYDLQLDIQNNTMIAQSDASYVTYISAEKSQHIQNLGTFKYNNLSASRDNQTIAIMHPGEGLCFAPNEFSLKDWQQASGHENGSNFDQLFTDVSFETHNDNLIANGKFATNIKGWTVWPEELLLVHEKKLGINNSALKVNFPAGSTEALLYNEGFSLNKGMLYKLVFTAWSKKESKIEFVPLMAASPWEALSEYTCFSLASTERTFIYYFRPTQDNENARVNFKSKSTFWINNISLHQIKETFE